MEQNETVAMQVGWNWMSFGLFIRTFTNKKKRETKKERGFMYKWANIYGAAHTRQTSVQQSQNYVGSTLNRVGYRANEEFISRILVQPSHFLLALEYDDGETAMESHTMQKSGRRVFLRENGRQFTLERVHGLDFR